MLTWCAAAAWAFDAIVALPAGSQIPSPARAMGVIAIEDGKRSVTLTMDYDGDATTFALLTASASPPLRVEPSSVDWLLRFDRATAPGLETLTCADLHERHHLVTSPGCSRVPIELPTWPGATYDVLALSEPTALVGTASPEVLTGDPEPWLASYGFIVPEALVPQLDAWLAAGATITATRIELLAPPTARGWLPAIRQEFSTDAEVALSLAPGAALASGTQDLVLHILTDEEDGDVIEGTGIEIRPDTKCMLDAAVVDLAAQLAGTTAALDAAPAPAWVAEWRGDPFACDPCSDLPLDETDLTIMGFEGDPSRAWLTRLHLRWNPGELTNDLLLVPTRVRSPMQLGFIGHDADLTWAFPICDAGFSDEPGTCPDIDPTGSGCHTGPGTGLVLALLLLRRRRLAVAVAVAAPAVALAGPIHHVALDFTPLATPRVVPDLAPRPMAAPQLGVVGDLAPISWGRGSVGPYAAVHAWRDDAMRGGAAVPLFTMVQPEMGVVIRPDRPGDGPVDATATVRVGLTLPILWASTASPTAFLGGQLEVGGGLRWGRGERRLLTEIVAFAVPRPDAVIDTFDPRTGLLGWRTNLGEAGLRLRVGYERDPEAGHPGGIRRTKKESPP